MGRHPKKEIRLAIEYALEHGWRLQKAGPRAHIWGTLLCPHAARDGCRRHVYSTPRDVDHHAEMIREAVDRCPH